MVQEKMIVSNLNEQFSSAYEQSVVRQCIFVPECTKT